MSAYSSLVVNDMHFSRIIALCSPSLRAIIPTLFSSLENQNKPTNQNFSLTNHSFCNILIKIKFYKREDFTHE